MSDPDFQARLNEAFEQALNTLLRLTQTADERVRLEAARAILELAADGVEARS